MINALIFATIAFGLILPFVGFIAHCHDQIVARKQPATPKPMPAPKPFKLGFKPALEVQSSNVLNHAPIRAMKAIASVNNLTAVTKEMFGKRYSLCNAEELRTALSYHYGIN